MPQSPSSGQPKILEALPKPLHKMKRFLLWKEHPGPNDKTKKTPYYADGGVRKGLLDTAADLKRLVTLDEAYDVYLLGGYSGIGFAIVGGDGHGAFDLDHCLTREGHLVPEHPGYELVLKAKKAGAYIEVSPSGRGLRIVGPCQNQEAYSKGGLEYWGAKRYVTLTGETWANAGGWVDLDGFREPLGARRTREDDEFTPEDGIITPRTIDELRSALEAIDADERTLWVKLGMALKTIGPKGKLLWLEWSKKSKKFNRADALDKWASFNPTHTSYKVVFTEAQENWGWQNPRKGKPELVVDNEEVEEEDPGDLESDVIELGDQRLYPTEFVLDGFLPAQVAVIAGAWGAGKSTNLIPLLASAAHLAPEDWGFWPALRRHILWITEAPEQARDTLYSLAKDEDAADWATIKEWFHLFPAHRMSPKKLARKIKRLAEPYSWTTPTGFRVKPVVVLDTTTANIDLENESDNSQVGGAMSVLKQELPGTPIVLIGHTPKALVKSEIAEMTFRGASAWEAEAAATYFLIHDPDTDMRFMAIRKARFTPTYREVDFEHSAGSEIVETPWGEPQAKSFLHGVPAKSTGEARKAAKEEAIEERREEAKEKVRTQRQERILAFVREAAAKGRLATKSGLRADIGGKPELISEALDRLIEADLVRVHVVTREQVGVSMGRVPEILLPAEVELEIFLKTVDGSGSGSGD